MITLNHLRQMCARRIMLTSDQVWFHDLAKVFNWLHLDWSTFFIARSTRWGVSESK